MTLLYNDSGTQYNASAVTYAGGVSTLVFTAVFDPVTSRVILTVSGLNAATASTQIVRWDGSEAQTTPNASIVRGGNLGAVTTGVAYDYTFVDLTLGTYRIQSFNSSGTLLDTDTVSVTPNNAGRAWMKSVFRPYLNRAVNVNTFSAISTSGRGTVFNVLGQSAPVVITDVASTRTLSITLVTSSFAEEQALASFFTPGDIMFWQPPNTAQGQLIPQAGYFYIAGVSDSRASTYGLHRYFEMSLIECAAPDPAIVGYTATWAGIVANFATWAAVEAAFSTWLQVEAYVNPTSTIVG